MSGVAVSRPLPKPLPLRCRARAPLHELLELPIPGLDEFGGDEPFSFELDVAAEHAAVLGKTLVLTPQSRTLSGTHLLMDVDWRPLRPLRSTVALVVNKASGGRWRYELALEAGEAEADDVISIEAAIGKTSAVSFKLSNVFEADAAFIAYFTPESPAVFSVRQFVEANHRAREWRHRVDTLRDAACAAEAAVLQLAAQRFPDELGWGTRI